MDTGIRTGATKSQTQTQTTTKATKRKGKIEPCRAVALMMTQRRFSSQAIVVIVAVIAGVASTTTSGQLAVSSVTPTSIFETSNRGGGQESAQVSHKSPLNGRQFGDTINDIQIECNSNNIVVTLQTNSGFNGMIYPKGLSKNSTCMVEYHQTSVNITYQLPLKSCNTMSTDVEDGIEYFNTVMVQPHRRLVTNQGRGYHIRCRYQTKERTITNQDQQLSVNLTQVTPAVMGSAVMPSCTMRIYSSADLQHEVKAENVRIGDELHLIIALDDQDVYGMLVTNCLVRDGLNWGEQPLIDDRGCPVDEEIMPEFVYAKNLTRASVTFQAHKFPYSSSVYYQCNVRLCFREGGCQAHVPPNCNGNSMHSNHLPSAARHQFDSASYAKSASENELELASNELSAPPARGAAQRPPQQQARTRRWVDAGELDGVASDRLLRPAPGGRDMTIEVASGLHVADRDAEPVAAAPSDSEDPLMMASTSDDPAATLASEDAAETDTAVKSARERQQREREFCMSLRRFAIIVSLISLLLMTAIIILIACLIRRRNQRKLDSQLNSTYDRHHSDGPYTNRAYCRD